MGIRTKSLNKPAKLRTKQISKAVPCRSRSRWCKFSNFHVQNIMMIMLCVIIVIYIYIYIYIYIS